jgi:hypothetical protein
MEEATPLVDYYSNNKLSLAEIAEIGLNLTNKAMYLDNSFTINDTNTFINSSKEVFFIGSFSDIYKKYFIITPYTIYDGVFETPHKKNRLLYSIGVVLYRMLNNGKIPFSNGEFSNKSYFKMERSKQQKVLPPREFFMNSPLGKIIEYSLSNFDSEEKSMYIFKTLLENYSYNLERSNQL